MPFASFVGPAIGAISAGVGLANQLGGGGVQAGAGNPVQNLPNQLGTAYDFLSLSGAPQGYAKSIPGSVIPNLQTAVGNITNNPYAPGAQTAANQAGAYGLGTLAPQMQAGSAALTQGGNQLMGTAFDPQMALYNRGAQQLTDQSNAINSMYGLSSSPAGAGLTQQALGNFNIDWQNQQLQRQLQGVQGAGRAFAGGADLGTGAMGTIQQSGQLPYSTYGGQQQNIINAQNALSQGATGAYGLDFATLNSLAQYLGLGQNAAQISTGQQNTAFNQQQQLGGQLGQSLSGLGRLFGGSGGSGGGGGGYANTYPAAASSAGVNPYDFLFGGGGGASTFPPG